MGNDSKQTRCKRKHPQISKMVMRQVTGGRPGQRKRKQQEKKEFGDVVSTEWGKGETQMHGWNTWFKKQRGEFVRGARRYAEGIIKAGWVRRYLGEPAFP